MHSSLGYWGERGNCSYASTHYNSKNFHQSPLMLWLSFQLNDAILSWGCTEKIQGLPSGLCRPSHSHCILRSCLKRVPGKMSSTRLEFGRAHSAACGTVFHLPVMSAVFIEQIAPRLQGWGRAPENPSPGPSPLGVGHSGFGQLTLWVGMQWARPDTSSINFLGERKSTERQPAFICLISAIPGVFGVLSAHWSQRLTGALHSNVHYIRPDIPDPRCSDFHPSLRNGQELHSEEEVAHNSFTP